MMNKSRSLLLLSVLAVLFAACEEGIIDNAILSQDYTEPEYSITANPSDIIISSEGGSSSIGLILSHNLPWKLTTGESWIRVSDTSGTGNERLTLTIDENPSTDTRSGKLQFEARKKSATVIVTQMGAGKKYFILSPESLSFSAEGGNKSIEVSTNLPWTVTASDSWIWLSADSGTGDFSLTVIASENATTSTRSGTVTFSAGGNSYTVNVTQTGTEEVHFVLSPESLSFPVEGGNKSIEVSTDLPWTATASDSWISLSADSGTGETSLTVNVNENATASNRSGTVTFSAGGNSYTVIITQTGTETNNNYLTFVALESTYFIFSQNDLQYSLDGGTTWTTLPADTSSPEVQAGERIMWKASGLTPSKGHGIGSFISTGKFNVEGNIMSLLFGNNYVGKTSLEGYDYAFYCLFSMCKHLEDAHNLIIPATTLANNCYDSMFYRCTSLVQAPDLPATTLAEDCYGFMFCGCTSLVQAPKLPAMMLANSCYDYMFGECTNLTTPPELPATTLAMQCYAYMFRDCISLTTPPELPATTLAQACYHAMFYDCTSLTTAPELPATELVSSCYDSMFYGCTSLNYIKCLATWQNGTSNWVKGVALSGTFVKNASMTGWTTGESGIPSGWTVKDFPEGGKTEEHEYVDLGLPSGLLWATMNVGASSPEDYGNYYAWGEVKTKTEQGKEDRYSEDTYKWISIVTTTDEYGFETTTKTFTKYWPEEANITGYTGIVDNKTVLDAEDDAAAVNWGGNWRMPTHADWNELTNTSNCTWEWGTLSGVNGYKVTSKMNDKFIFLPAAGCHDETDIQNEGTDGFYWWSSSLYVDIPLCAWLYSSGRNGYVDSRYYGLTVRPVCRP